MLHDLFNCFKTEVGMESVHSISSSMIDILELFSEEYLKDKSMKNAAIDAIISLLEQHKDKENPNG